MQLLVLREVKNLDPVAREMINAQDGFYGDNAQYVNNDYARDDVVTSDILAASAGFAIATPQGEILKAGIADLQTAEALRAGAKVSFGVELAPVTPDADEPVLA